MKILSLKTKLFMAMSLLVLVFAIFIVFFIRLYLKDLFMKDSINDAKVVAATMESHMVDYLLIRDFVAIDSYCDEMMKANTELAYIFIEKDGEILFHTFKEGFPRDLLSVGHNRNIMDHTMVRTEKGLFLDLSTPIHGGREGTLRIGLDERMGEKALRGAIMAIAAVTALFMGIAFAIAMIIARRLTASLTSLTVSASEIAGGHYSGTVHVAGYDEIGKLAMAYNTMLQAVRLREEELKSLNTELETVNVTLHDYIQKLHAASEELVRSKQDAAVVDTVRTFFHHLRQPLTYLIMATEMLADDLAEGKPLTYDSVGMKIAAVSNAAERLAELLRKFEGLQKYRVINFDDIATIVDIEDQSH